MAYTRQILNSLSDSDLDRLYDEDTIDESYYKSARGWGPSDIKTNLKKDFIDAFAAANRYVVGIFDDDLLIQIGFLTKTDEFDGQTRAHVGHVLKAKNKSDTKSWIYDASIANGMTPTSKVLHAGQDVIGLFVETQTKDMYDLMKAGANSDLNLTEIQSYNDTTKIAVFVTDFGFE